MDEKNEITPMSRGEFERIRDDYLAGAAVRATALADELRSRGYEVRYEKLPSSFTTTYRFEVTL